MASQSFALDVSRWVEKAKAQPELVFRKVALDVQRRVMERTPVANPASWKRPVKGYVGGRARAGWGLSMTGTYTAVLSNTVPYITALEYGHSKQAPGGMVRLTIAEFSQIVSEAAKD